MPYGTLYLIPTGLGSDQPALFLPEATRSILHGLRHFVVEHPKTARAFLKSAGHPLSLQTLGFAVLDEHTASADHAALLQPLLGGTDVGLMSEAGCPAIADPGAGLVRRAHEAGIRVAPLVGPSAILLALMASGMNGQRFAFHGYLPVEAAARREAIARLEAASRRDDATQVFIETPYRNEALVDAMLQTCRNDTLLCIAADLTQANETIRTLPIAAWRRQPLDLKRRPAVFLLYCGTS